MSVITLTTDFGTSDSFVGTMKGVIARIAPKAAVVDISHEGPAGDIRAGAFMLAAACVWFPKGTVHVAVVDPGVGSGRKAVAMRTASQFFVGPDNGVLSLALRREKVQEIRMLENEAWFLRPVSATFHGRDVFAPVAAHLSRGVPMRKLGPAAKDYARLEWPEPRRGRGHIAGEVIYIDRFGNAITNVDCPFLRELGAGRLEVFLDAKRRCEVGAYYLAVEAGQAVAVSGSSGFLEIAVNGGNAAKALGLRVGTVIEVRLGRTVRRAVC